MAGWSSLAFRNIGKTNLIRSAVASSKHGYTLNCLISVPVRNSGHGNVFPIKPSQYRFMKLRDLAHFYFVLGVLPIGALLLYCNIFIGPAKLAEIPENYVPKHWEYYEHPVTRWIARLFPSPQECYEKDLHKIYIKGQTREIKKLERKIEDFMKEREDYQAWYFMDTGAKYTRKSFEVYEESRKQQGKGFGLVH